MKSIITRKNLVATLLGATLCAGCGQPSQPSATNTPATPAVASTPEPTPEQKVDLTAFADDTVKARAQALAEAHDGKRFPREELKGPENGPALLYLVLTAEGAVKTSALKQLDAAYTSSKSNEKQTLADKAHGEVVLHLLNSADEAEQYYGLMAAKDCFSKDGHKGVKAKVLEMAVSHPKAGGRYQAFDTLGYHGDRSTDTEALDVYLKGFQDEPIVVYMALYWTRTLSNSPRKEEFKTALQALLDHQSEAVRGEALFAFGRNFGRSDGALVLEKATPMLQDPSPFVRAKALEALSDVKDPKVFEVLAPLLDDPAETKVQVEYTNLLGKAVNKRITTFGWGRVDGTALKTMRDDSRRLKHDPPYETGKVDFQKKAQDIAREVKAAKEWLAKQ